MALVFSVDFTFLLCSNVGLFVEHIFNFRFLISEGAFSIFALSLFSSYEADSFSHNVNYPEQSRGAVLIPPFLVYKLFLVYYSSLQTISLRYSRKNWTAESG